MICSNCGQSMLSKATGECLGCGFRRVRFDVFSCALAIAGLTMCVFFVVIIEAGLAVSIFDFFNLGAIARNAIAALMHVIPISFSADAVFMAFRRRKTHKTMLGMILGIAGVVAGVVLLLRWFINIF